MLSSPGAYCVALHDHRRSAKSRTFAIRLGGGYDWARQGPASGPATVGKQRPPPIPRVVGSVQAVQKQRGEFPLLTERTRRPVRAIGRLPRRIPGPGNSCWHAGHRRLATGRGVSGRPARPHRSAGIAAAVAAARCGRSRSIAQLAIGA